ncbi:MAG TPA: hypothetical protein VJG64_03240 [Candidatus Paceibacterota bacterium]
MKRDHANLVLRAGLAFAFLYPPLNAIFDPNAWIGYFPHFMRGVVPDPMLLHSFGIVEIVLALWILSDWKIFWPSAAAALILLTIVFFGWNDLQVLFRDLSIASIALALALQNYPGAFRKKITTA